MKLVPEWRSWWRMSSTWFQAAAAAFFSYLTAVPDAAIQLWSVLPEDLRQAFPPGYVKWFGVALIAIGIVARLVRQPSLNERRGPDSP
jgi:cyanate permease